MTYLLVGRFIITLIKIPLGILVEFDKYYFYLEMKRTKNSQHNFEKE